MKKKKLRKEVKRLEQRIKKAEKDIKNLFEMHLLPLGIMSGRRYDPSKPYTAIKITKIEDEE